MRFKRTQTAQALGITWFGYNGASSSRCSAARQPSGRSLRVRNSRSECGASPDLEIQARNAAFRQALQQLGWTDQQNVQIDYRWVSSDNDHIRRVVAELVALTPDAILATGSPNVGALHKATRPSRLCSWVSSTRSAPASSIASRVQAATSRASLSSNMA